MSLGLAIGICLGGGGGGFTPAGLGSSLVEWWNGNAGISLGSNNTWTGLKGGNVLTSAGFTKPTYTAGPPGFWTSDGASTGMKCAGFPSKPQPFEYWIGFKPTSASPATQGFVLDFGASDACQFFQNSASSTFTLQGSISSVVPTTNAYSFVNVQWNGSSTILSLNGTANAPATSASAGTGGLAAGVAFSVNTNHFTGNLYEIIVCGAILTASQRQQMNAYMSVPH